MRVTAKEILAAWLDRDDQSPYFIEQNPIGTDRKRVEGPFPTNESYPNSWLPTRRQVETEGCPVEQLEVVTVEIATAKRADLNQPVPGVPMPLFKAWENAHDAEMDFAAGQDLASLTSFVNTLVEMIKEAERVGLHVMPEHIARLQDYPRIYRPDRGDEYSRSRGEEILNKLDHVLGSLHSEIVRLTGSQKEQWYEYQAQQMKNTQHFNTQVMNLSPEEERELGIYNKITPEELRERRGPMAPFLEDAWRRKKKHELKGMRITAVDVDVEKLKKTRKRKPKKQDSFDESIDQTVRELDAPKPQPKAIPQLHTEVSPEIEVSQEEDEYSLDPSSVGKTIGEIADWEDGEADGSSVEGAVFFYRKTIPLSNHDGENTIDFIAFVEPFAARKKRLLDMAKRNRGYGRTDRESMKRAEELEREAGGMPDRGYINDIEGFYRSELFFHRERSFTPKAALSSREFMAGDSMQRAITDLQQFVRTKIDPIPVGQFYQQNIEKPGLGELKLSQREESMKITAADVIPFDPSRRKGPHAPRKGPQRATPRLEEAWDKLRDHPDLARYKDMSAEDIYQDLQQREEMEQAYQEDFGATQGDLGGDVDALFYFYDNIAGSLADVRDHMVRAVQSANPEQKTELARLIRNIERAIQVLGQ